MRTVFGAHAAVFAYDRKTVIAVIMDRTCDTGLFAFTAAYAEILVKNNTATFSLREGTRRAAFHAGSLAFACKAYDSGEFILHSAH
jgi:hypothetical protein